MHDDASDILFDDAREHSKRGGETIIPVREDEGVGALGPGLVERSVDSFLHVLAIKVDRRLCCFARKILPSIDALGKI